MLCRFMLLSRLYVGIMGSGQRVVGEGIGFVKQLSPKQIYRRLTMPQMRRKTRIL
jgi:hypothetical protein